MTGAFEPFSHHGGSPLPPVLFAPGQDGVAEAYWRGAQSSPVGAGDAVTVRSATWLVEDAAVWRGRPGGVHLRLRQCNAVGTLTPRSATKSGYGVQLVDGAPLDILGVLNVLSTDDPDGHVETRAELVPAGSWAGRSGDLISLTGTRWEQVGDAMDRASGSWTPLPVVRMRRART